MRIRLRLTMALALALLATQSLAQPQPADPAATGLATARLPSLVDMPMFLRLYGIRLRADRRTLYEGSNAMLYDLSGAVAVEIGGTRQSLPAGGGIFIEAGRAATISASASEPARLLLFVLTARPNQGRVVLDRSAVATELFRTSEPLPGLRAGPYEFTLTRLVFPAGMPANPPYRRSGAALDYVLAGTAALVADEKTDTIVADKPLFEGYGWVHQLANPGDGPLVLLQANISPEDEPAVHVVAEK